jgi:hypothetical protein
MPDPFPPPFFFGGCFGKFTGVVPFIQFPGLPRIKNRMGEVEKKNEEKKIQKKTKVAHHALLG